jgi:hypothetical protein
VRRLSETDEISWFRRSPATTLVSMGEPAVWSRFPDELPACCASARLRLPRPVDAFIDVRGEFGRDEMWMLGLDEWFVRVGVTWDGEEAALAKVVNRHVGGALDDLDQVLTSHGINLDEDGSAWVGQQDVVVARLGSDLADVSGRRSIQDGHDLLLAADDAASDLEQLVGPLIAGRDDPDEMWSDGVLGAWPDVFMTSAVILLRGVSITPVMRGHLLGAWTAAQSIQIFDHGGSLVVTKAAPLARRDAIPNLDPEQLELTPQQSALWRAEQDRLAQHWQTHLGLAPLPDDSRVMTWHTSYKNEAIANVLGLWA